ncbi:DUF2520 domain-containing protein, partial [candidate division WOR-3 bacterium]|nr:DUF2520 domain-containing protein [candidate division WOR-3 bacterium]
IGLIGCGKVGTTIFHLLKKHNHITGVYDINKKNEKRALKLLRIKRKLTLDELCIKSQALFFATPDDKILAAYKKAKPFIKGKKYIFHFSGLLPAGIFPKSKNTYRASVHPFATFPKISIPATRKKYILFIEGDTPATKAAKRIFIKKYFIINKIRKEQKIYHHLIGVFSSNLMIGLISAIYEMTKSTHWNNKEINDVIMPIIKETLNNIEINGIKNALSGPLERGDIEIIKKHLKTLKKNKNLLDIYKTLSLVILKNVVKNGKKKELENLLNQ